MIFKSAGYTNSAEGDAMGEHPSALTAPNTALWEVQ